MKVYVVSQNDFATVVFRTRAKAEEFVARQEKRTVSGRPIYWRIDVFELGE